MRHSLSTTAASISVSASASARASAPASASAPPPATAYVYGQRWFSNGRLPSQHSQQRGQSGGSGSGNGQQGDYGSKCVCRLCRLSSAPLSPRSHPTLTPLSPRSPTLSHPSLTPLSPRSHPLLTPSHPALTPLSSSPHHQILEFTPRDIIGAALFIAGSAFTCKLGMWQLDRREQKQAMIDHRTSRLEAAPVSLVDLLASVKDTQCHDTSSSSSSSSSGGDGAADNTSILQFRKVLARGTPLYHLQCTLGPRGAPPDTPPALAPTPAGYYILTPFVLENGVQVLLNRGWISGSDAPARIDTPQEIPEEDGLCSVAAVLGKSETKPQFLSESDESKRSRKLIFMDIDRIARTVPGFDPQSPPMILDVVDGNTDSPKLVRKDISQYITFNTMPEMHMIYAGTWFTLSAAILVLLGYRVRRIRLKRIF
jgi:cytochrome oxidase assembly protein ShyY1